MAGWSNSADEMKGKDKPAKKIKEVRVRKGTSGGHIIEHHHHSPEHHPMEEHATNGDAAMMAHMQQAMGTPPDGSAPDASAAPPPSGAAPDMAAGAPPATA
jgi:hypothetical protein